MSEATTTHAIRIGPVRFRNPYFSASGCFGYGLEYRRHIPPDALGAVVTKTVTPLPRSGNPTPRLQETSSGLLNSIGLQNVGLETYLREKLPPLLAAGGTPFVSIAATTLEEYAAMADRIAEYQDIVAVEVNLGCPNVDAGGDKDAAEARAVEEFTRTVKSRLPDRAVAVKLTPNVTDIVHLAEGAEQGGADAVVAINTVVGMDIDLQHSRPVFARVRAGLSGPAIFPIALLKVWEIAERVRIPVVAVGGIGTADDVLKFFMAGATAVQLGTVLFSKPTLLQEVQQGVDAFLGAKGLRHPHQLWLPHVAAREGNHVGHATRGASS
jgi:dihydroorotate dehydrogenase (NAD+) catalytic subunit